jgi:tRNA pseudouridine38-40 synthase
VARYALLVEYLGTHFHGSQFQLNDRTVQNELESALAKFLREPIRVVFSGRTDKGVHALGQVAHFDTSVGDLDLWRFNWGVNGILPRDLSVKMAAAVSPHFHARYDAISRRYVYRILNCPQRSAVFAQTHHFVPHKLNYLEMQRSCNYLVGAHDFASFKSANADSGSTKCIVTDAQLLNLGEGQLEFWIEANHFVYNMVRIIVGSLIEIGLGTRPADSLRRALQECDRNLAGATAPAQGLTLVSVKYPEPFKWG